MLVIATSISILSPENSMDYISNVRIVISYPSSAFSSATMRSFGRAFARHATPSSKSTTAVRYSLGHEIAARFCAYQTRKEDMAMLKTFGHLYIWMIEV